MALKVLLIEDDAPLGESLQEYLQGKGMAVTWFDDGDAVSPVSAKGFDAIVLDLVLRGRQGEDILRDLKTAGTAVPVLVLTAKAGLKDKTVCFTNGADDYLTKPFEPLELVLRLEALTRRENGSARIDLGNVTMDLDSRMLFADGQEVKVSARAWDLLELLVRRRGKIVSKEDIMSSVWSDVLVKDDVIRHYIKELRKILPEDCIETHKGRGYRLR